MTVFKLTLAWGVRLRGLLEGLLSGGAGGGEEESLLEDGTAPDSTSSSWPTGGALLVDLVAPWSLAWDSLLTLRW